MLLMQTNDCILLCTNYMIPEYHFPEQQLGVEQGSDLIDEEEDGDDGDDGEWD